MKIKRLLKYIVLLSCIAFGIHLSFEPLYTPTALSTPPFLTHFPKYVAHKSTIAGGFYGNTFEAIQEALASYVDGIEVDIRLSKDGVHFSSSK